MSRTAIVKTKCAHISLVSMIQDFDVELMICLKMIYDVRGMTIDQKILIMYKS